MNEDTPRTSIWVEALIGPMRDYGPYEDVVAASEAMDELGLSDSVYKIIDYGEPDEDDEECPW